MDYFGNRYFAGRYFPPRYYQGGQGGQPPVGVQIKIYSGVSKAPMSGISVTSYELTMLGDGSYTVDYSSTVSDNRTDSPNYEGIEIL
jgi:hypothetical protein